MEMGSLLLFALVILGDTCQTTKGAGLFAIQYWEQRLDAMDGGKAWLKEQLFRDLADPDLKFLLSCKTTANI